MAQVHRFRLRRDPSAGPYALLRTRLVEARKAAGLTQQELADRLGQPQSFVAKVEGGERTLDVVELVAVAKVIGFATGKLLEDIAAELPR